MNENDFLSERNIASLGAVLKTVQGRDFIMTLLCSLLDEYVTSPVSSNTCANAARIERMNTAKTIRMLCYATNGDEGASMLRLAEDERVDREIREKEARKARADS